MFTLNDNDFEKKDVADDVEKTVELTPETDIEKQEETPAATDTATSGDAATADAPQEPVTDAAPTDEKSSKKQQKKEAKREKKARRRADMRKSFTTKSFKAGGYTLVVCAIAVAAAILVNSIASMLPTRYTKLDASANDVYSLSEYSKEIARKIDTAVTISLVATVGNEDTTIKTLIERYADINDNITIKTVDPEINVLASGTSEQSMAENSLIFDSEKRSKNVDYNSMYSYSDEMQQYAYYGYDVSPDVFDGENEITSALIYVTTDKLPTAYSITGHGETSLSEAVLSYVAKENIEVKNLDLLKNGAIPDDCECLIISAPEKDISEDEKNMILAYLENGGCMFVTTSFEAASSPNLDAVMIAYGVERVNGMIMESDSSYCYQYLNYLMPEILSHEITDDISDSNYRVYMPSSHGIKQAQSVRSTLEITPLLTTSDSSYAKEDVNFTSEEDTQQKDTDEKGPFSVGCAIAETNGDKETKLVWFSTPYFLDDSFLNYTGNINLLLNSLKWMCDLEENISLVEAKSVSQYNQLEVSSATGYIWCAVFTGALPLAALITGITVWVKRRKR